MILHHVAQGAGGVVVAGAAFDAEGFGDRDLHVVDMGGVPQGFEQDVGEAQRHQVLDRFLAEIMIDPVDAVFGEGAGNGVVHRAGGGEAFADGFLDDDAGGGRDDAVGAQAVADGAEELGGGGEVEDADAAGLVGEGCGEGGPAGFAVGVGGDVAEAGEEIGDGGVLTVGGGDVGGDGVAGLGAEDLVGHGAAGDADDAGVRRDLPGGPAVGERGEELAAREVAGGAEDDEVEGVDGDDAGRHVSTP